MLFRELFGNGMLPEEVKPEERLIRSAKWVSGGDKNILKSMACWRAERGLVPEMIAALLAHSEMTVEKGLTLMIRGYEAAGRSDDVDLLRELLKKSWQSSEN